jgi:hypothetical protein
MLYYLRFKKSIIQKTFKLAYSKEKESIFCFDKNPGINNKTKIG